MDWKSAQEEESGIFSIPKRWLHIHYYEALNILFRTENSLRVFVYTILKNKSFEKWADTIIQVSEKQQSSIEALAKQRIAQAQGFGYLGYEIMSPLMHLNSGELVRLITSDAMWGDFKDHFKGKKEVIRTKLDEVGTIRNSLAHFRPIKKDDIELIKQNVKHALIGVEECRSEMIQTYNVVPTNTEAKWYKDLKTSGTELCEIQIYQSNNEEWIRLQITFNSSILNVAQWWAEYFSYTVTNLVTPAIIRLFENIRKYVTYVAEYVPYAKLDKERIPSFRKSISQVFRRDVLIDNSESITNDIKAILLKIQEEVALVGKDNLAKGELIESARTAVKLDESGEEPRWVTESHNLKCPFRENDPAEYWADVGLYQRDFIAGTIKYPWMPSTIANQEDSLD